MSAFVPFHSLRIGGLRGFAKSAGTKDSTGIAEKRVIYEYTKERCEYLLNNYFL